MGDATERQAEGGTLSGFDATSFAIPITRLAPSWITSRILFDVPPGWTRLNPSVAEHGGRVRMAVRSTNFRWGNGVMYVQGNSIRNRTYIMDVEPGAELSGIDVLSFEGDGTGRSALADRVEDVRIFGAGGVWYAMGTVIDTGRRVENGYHPGSILIGRLDDRNVVRNVTVIQSPFGQPVEKNWMPCPRGDDIALIYSPEPMTVLSLRKDFGAIRIAETGPSVTVPSGWRGSSQVIAFGDKLLFVMHRSVTVGGKRIYAHRFVETDHSFGVLSQSDSVCFVEYGIEFCAGIARTGDSILLSFGMRDEEALLGTLSVEDLRVMLKPCGIGAQAANR